MSQLKVPGCISRGTVAVNCMFSCKVNNIIKKNTNVKSYGSAVTGCTKLKPAWIFEDTNGVIRMDRLNNDQKKKK